MTACGGQSRATDRRTGPHVVLPDATRARACLRAPPCPRARVSRPPRPPPRGRRTCPPTPRSPPGWRHPQRRGEAARRTLEGRRRVGAERGDGHEARQPQRRAARHVVGQGGDVGRDDAAAVRLRRVGEVDLHAGRRSSDRASAAARSSAVASSGRSTDCTTSAYDATERALLRCSWPTKCQRSPRSAQRLVLGPRLLVAVLRDVGDAERRRAAATSDAGQVLVTTTSVTSSGARPRGDRGRGDARAHLGEVGCELAARGPARCRRRSRRHQRDDAAVPSGDAGRGGTSRARATRTVQPPCSVTVAPAERSRATTAARRSRPGRPPVRDGRRGGRDGDDLVEPLAGHVVAAAADRRARRRRARGRRGRRARPSTSSAAPTTSLRTPRQPACTTATTPASPSASSTGTQSAATTSSARPGTRGDEGVDLGHRLGAAGPSTCPTSRPCTGAIETTCAGVHADRRRPAPPGWRATWSGSSPTWSARLPASYGATAHAGRCGRRTPSAPGGRGFRRRGSRPHSVKDRGPQRPRPRPSSGRGLGQGKLRTT